MCTSMVKRRKFNPQVHVFAGWPLLPGAVLEPAVSRRGFCFLHTLTLTQLYSRKQLPVRSTLHPMSYVFSTLCVPPSEQYQTVSLCDCVATCVVRTSETDLAAQRSAETALVACLYDRINDQASQLGSSSSSIDSSSMDTSPSLDSLSVASTVATRHTTR